MVWGVLWAWWVGLFFHEALILPILRCFQNNKDFPWLWTKLLHQLAEFDPVSVGVLQENLGGTVGPEARAQEISTLLPEMLQHFLHVFDPQGKVGAPGMGVNGLIPLPDQVQLLPIVTEAKPSPGKVKGRSGNLRQLQHVPVKFAAFFDVLHVQGHMVELGDTHLF